MAIDLITELENILEALARRTCDYAVCGGIAVNIYGHARTTRDIDVLVLEDDLEQIQACLLDIGYTFKAGPIPFQTGTEQERVLYRVTKVEGPDMLTIDLLLVTPALRAVWDGRTVYNWNGRTLSVVSLEGLATMKKMAGRHQDLADLENLGLNTDEN